MSSPTVSARWVLSSLAAGVSQPAVSQHLKVLRDADLVRMRPDAQRRLYSLEPAGFRVVEQWLESHRRASG